MKNYDKYKVFVFLRVLKSLSSEPCITIINVLLEKNKINEMDLVDITGKSLQTVSYHIEKLRQAKFIEKELIGRTTIIRIIRNKKLELNYMILKTMEKWFAGKEGPGKEFEDAFIESILSPRKMSSFKKLLNAVEKREAKKKKK